MKASLVHCSADRELLVVPVDATPLDGRVKIESRSWTVFVDHVDALELAKALTIAAKDVETRLREMSIPF